MFGFHKSIKMGKKSESPTGIEPTDLPNTGRALYPQSYEVIQRSSYVLILAICRPDA